MLALEQISTSGANVAARTQAVGYRGSALLARVGRTSGSFRPAVLHYMGRGQFLYMPSSHISEGWFDNVNVPRFLFAGTGAKLSTVAPSGDWDLVSPRVLIVNSCLGS